METLAKLYEAQEAEKTLLDFQIWAIRFEDEGQLWDEEQEALARAIEAEQLSSLP